MLKKIEKLVAVFLIAIFSFITTPVVTTDYYPAVAEAAVRPVKQEKKQVTQYELLVAFEGSKVFFGVSSWQEAMKKMEYGKKYRILTKKEDVALEILSTCDGSTNFHYEWIEKIEGMEEILVKATPYTKGGENDPFYCLIFWATER